MKLNSQEILGCVAVGVCHWLLAAHEPIEARNPALIAENIAGDVLAIFILYFLGKLIWLGMRRVTEKRAITHSSPPESPKENTSLEGQIEAIGKRMGRLEQLINVVLEKQKHQSLKLERRIELSFDGIRDRIAASSEQLEFILGEIQEGRDFESSQNNVSSRIEAEPSSKDRRDRLLNAVVKSLKQEQKWRDQKAKEFGWPIHPNDIDWLDEAERKVMLQVFSERGPFRQEWLNPNS